MAPSRESTYEAVMANARETVFILALRQGVAVARLDVTFDTERGPGPHEYHTLTISVRDSDVKVHADRVEHEWLPVSTGFADSRFSNMVTGMLSTLVDKAMKAGRFI
ncbi:MAG TPA: hypothetical protein VHB46_04430 [Burkholderiales bacterium]|nr:hypothetical protein [Burkholderiales bacterium]